MLTCSVDNNRTVAQANMKVALPYRQSYTYNAFDNLTARTNLSWGVDYFNGRSFDFTRTYQNDRVTNAGWQYDADGRLLAGDDNTATYNAAGQIAIYETSDGETSAERKYDGDGREAKRIQSNVTWDGSVSATETKNKYYIRSTVLGGATLSEADEAGRKVTTNIYAAGTLLAVQRLYHDSTNNTDSEVLRFEQTDASALSHRSILATGTAITGEAFDSSPAELDPLGGNVGIVSHFFNFTRPRSGFVTLSEIYSIANLFNFNNACASSRRVNELLGENLLSVVESKPFCRATAT